jgi:membrane-bound ClpP family serine protease
MLMWIIILSLLLIGLALIIVELVFIPGTTVVGVLGLVFAIVGIVISYSHFGSDIGFYILLGSVATTAGAIFYAFRAGAWKRFAHKSSIDSKVNEGIMSTVQIGDEGVTLSTLRPMGKAEFHNQTFEVKTSGNYIDRGEKVKITRIESHQIVVEPLN